MFLDEFRTLQKVSLPIRLDKVVANAVNIVNNHEFYILLLDSLSEIKKDLVIIFYVLAVMHYDILADCHFSDSRLVLN